MAVPLPILPWHHSSALFSTPNTLLVRVLVLPFTHLQARAHTSCLVHRQHRLAEATTSMAHAVKEDGADGGLPASVAVARSSEVRAWRRYRRFYTPTRVRGCMRDMLIPLALLLGMGINMDMARRGYPCRVCSKASRPRFGRAGCRNQVEKCRLVRRIVGFTCFSIVS